MVLEARYKAEKVWYPVVWEKVKEKPDVIDYNINEEVTTDATAVFNANNDTTTGMATIIPWVNAPKLIQSTSILSDVLPYTWWVLLTGSKQLSYPNDTSWNLRTWTLSDQYWNIPFKIKTDWSSVLWNGFLIPVAWWYEFYIAYPTWASTYALDVSLYISRGWYGNDILIHSYTWEQSNVHYYWTFRYEFKAWDVIFASETLRYYWSASSFTSNREWTIQVTKI